MRRSSDVAARFWRRVARGSKTQCWLWQGTCDQDGYGLLKVPKVGTRGAHRYAFFLTHGRWPRGEIRHSCHNPPCCNPEHLGEGTHKENMRDLALSGRRKGKCFGEQGGRSRISDRDRYRILELRSQGLLYREISKIIGISACQASKIVLEWAPRVGA